MRRGNVLKICKIHLYLIAVIVLLFCGCSARLPFWHSNNSQEFANPADTLLLSTNIIAVLPIENSNLNSKTSQFLRKRLFEELYFKGYPKLTLDLIDKKLQALHAGTGEKGADLIPPQKLKELTGADAGMYCTITSEDKPNKLFYAPMTLAVQCELRSSLNGEILWNAQGQSTSRNFDVTRKGLERKSHEDLETVVEEVVKKIMETLPDGPNLR